MDLKTPRTSGPVSSLVQSASFLSIRQTLLRLVRRRNFHRHYGTIRGNLPGISHACSDGTVRQLGRTLRRLDA